MRRQMLAALGWLHAHGVLHRDVKPRSLLLQPARGLLKLGGFELARSFSVPVRSYTHEVITLWYRPPEILLGARRYACPVDAWSAGCVLSEMATGRPLFPGDSEIDTIYRIFRLLGTPSTDAGSWAGASMHRLPDWNVRFPAWRRQDLVQTHASPTFGADGVALLERLLDCDPSARIGCQEALSHAYFAGFEPSTVGQGPANLVSAHAQPAASPMPLAALQAATGTGAAVGLRTTSDAPATGATDAALSKRRRRIVTRSVSAQAHADALDCAQLSS